MIKLIYDTETFKDLHHVTFINVDTLQKLKLTWWEGMPLDLANKNNELYKSMVDRIDVIWIGYNNKKYDSKMVKFCAAYNFQVHKILYQLKQWSDFIINNRKWWQEYKNIPTFAEYKSYYNIPIQLDLLALHRLQRSLKSIGVTINFNNIEELPFDPDERIDGDLEKIKKIENYCDNDCMTTLALYHYSEGELKTRRAFANLYPETTPGSYDSMSRSLLSQIVIRKWIADKGLELNTVHKVRDAFAKRSFYGSNILFDVYDFKTKEGNEILNCVKNHYFDMTLNKRTEFNHKLKFGNCQYSFGEGGLHTKDSGLYVESTDTIKLVGVDVESYYPNLIYKYKLFIKTLQFLADELKTIIDVRLKAKHSLNKYKKDTPEYDEIDGVNQSLKIVINAISGLLGSPDSDIYYKPAHLAMTINGQLMLFSLVEMLELKGFEVFSVNTDGVFFYAHKDKLKAVDNILNEWQQRMQVNLELDMLKTFCSTATNNYMYVTEKNKIKAVGIFNTNPDIAKSASMVVLRKALFNFVVNKTPVNDTILNHDNIHDFLLTQTTDKKFDVFVYNPITNECIQPLKKVNRWYWSTESPCNLSKFQNGVLKGKISNSDNSVPLNKIISIKPIAYHDLDYQRYIEEAKSIINSITITNIL